jgi:branched-chain amino acid transport system permease protein
MAKYIANAIQVTIGGLATGGLYALMLLGVILVFQVSRNMNFAYGQVGMAGVFVSYMMYNDFGLPVWIAILVGMAAAVAISAIADFVIIRRIPERNGYDVVVTLGLLLLLTAVTQLIFGASAKSYLTLYTDVAVVQGKVFVNVNDVASIALGILAAIVGYLVLTRTNLGISIRAAAADPAIAQSVGINIFALRTGIWAASAVFVVIGAMMFASRLSLNTFFMTPIIINVFIAGMIGGLDRYWPPMLVAFGIALYQSWAIYLFGEAGATPALFILVIGVLSIVPKRYLEERHEARA